MSEYVLVTRNWQCGWEIYHKPGDDPDMPDCHAGKVNKRGWIRKDPDVLPADARLCKDCAGESERHTHQGPTLAKTLNDLDPEAI